MRAGRRRLCRLPRLGPGVRELDLCCALFGGELQRLLRGDPVRRVLIAELTAVRDGWTDVPGLLEELRAVGGVPVSRAMGVALGLLATVANAASWSLTPVEVETLVPVREQLVLVAAAGEPRADVRDVAKTVELAVQASGRAKLVMNDAALGPLGAATDDEVRAKAATVPHQVLIIVRVFPQGADRSLVALVAASGPGATAPRTVTLQPQLSQPPAPPPPPPPATSPPVVVDPKLAEYEARRLHFGQKSRIPGKKLADFVYDEPAYEGTKRLTTTQLFERLGRQDFLESSKQRATVRTGLGLAAGALAVLGAGLIVTDFASACGRWNQSETRGYCLQRRAEGFGWVGAGFIGAGVVTGLVALILPAHASSRADVGRAVEEHNAKLRQSLGLSSLRLAPEVGVEGGRLLISGNF